MVDKWKEDLLMSILECGIQDLDKMEEILSKAENWLVDIDFDDVIENAKDLGRIDFNTILYAIMENIVYDLVEDIEDEKIREKILDNFNPFLNYLDSYFNNCLDELDEKSTREEAIKCLIEEVEEKEEV